MILAPQKETGRTTHETPATHSTTDQSHRTPVVSTSQRRRLPAYGRQVADLRERGLAPMLALLICDGWTSESIVAEHEPWVIVVPDGDTPGAFDFRICAGLFVYIVGDDSERINAIVEHVQRFAPRMVYSWSADQDVFTFHVRVTA